MKKYKVLKPFLFTVEGQDAMEIPVDSIVTDVMLGDEKVSEFIADGSIELVPEVEKTEEELAIEEATAKEVSDKETADTEVVKADPKLYYNGKLILSDTTREVEGRTMNHVKLEDGTEQDLTGEEYQAVLNAASK